MSAVRRILMSIVAAGALGLLGCKSDAKDDAAKETTLTPPASSSSSIAAVQPAPKESRYTRFKVTSAKPADVESAMQQGWKLVNCSLASRTVTRDGRTGFLSGGVIILGGEHCYFEGDEHVQDGDAGAGPPGG